jgi:phospholipid transport system substrate-binding protein
MAVSGPRLRHPAFVAVTFLFVAAPSVSARAAHVGSNPVPPAGSWVAPGDPLNELRRADLALEAVLRRRIPDWSPEAEVRKQRLDAILGGLLDYERIARGALGADWSGLSGEQQREFLQTFAALTNQAFVAAMTHPDLHLRFDSETVLGSVASVMVTAWVATPTPKSEQQIEYRLARRQDRWLVTDVVVDQVSLVDGYRDQFARLLRRGGFGELMERMQHRLEESNRR